jgi:hydroxyacylglutathione hydrolase
MSNSATLRVKPMLNVKPLPAFTDNYIWLIHGRHDERSVAVVDPGDAEPVLRELKARDLTLRAILITHHHADHVGGVKRLLHAQPGGQVAVFGPAGETIPGTPRALSEGDRIELDSLGLQFEVLNVPGHTLGHIAYVGHGTVFCGDTLFSGGCGRLFEGTAEQMANSLDKLARLDGGTQVYCTHEYTLANLAFAHAVEPDNAALADYQARCRARRRQQQPTLPSTIALEHTVNPFLRCHVDTVKQAAEAYAGQKLNSTVAVFAAIRAWKDGFRAAT